MLLRIGLWRLKKRTTTTLIIQQATIEDAREILALQKRAFLQEAKLQDNFLIAPMVQTLSELENEFPDFLVLKGSINGRIIGSVRGKIINDKCYIGRLIVDPVFQQKGYGSTLLNAIESRFSHAAIFELFTGESSDNNIRFYSKRGYIKVESYDGPDGSKLVKMIKARNESTL